MVHKLSRTPRALSSFNPVTQRWTAIPLPRLHHRLPSSNRADAVGNQSLTLTSWNIRASLPWPVPRSKLVINRILEGPKLPDIIHLQEVSFSVRQSLLEDPSICAGFLTTDAEDGTSFKHSPFTTMTLLSHERFRSPLQDREDEGEGKLMLHSVFRKRLHTRFKKDALCVAFVAPAAPGAVLRLFNVHLDSLDSHPRRALALSTASRLLHSPNCKGGIIAGDFNATLPEDHKLFEKPDDLLDAWVALHGSTGSDGATWEVGTEQRKARRDKVVMLGLKPDEIEVLQPGLFKRSKPWSDHCGLRCTFTI